MRKILSWYKGHFLRAYDMEEYWPWQRGWWANIGHDDNRWRRTGSFLIVLMGVNLFFYSLMVLFVLIAVILQVL